jgi:hypothetical protein
MYISGWLVFIDELLRRNGIDVKEMQSKPGRKIVGVMHHPKNRARIERDPNGKFFAVCSTCPYESEPVDTFDAANKLVTEHRGHCSGIQNKGA